MTTVLNKLTETLAAEATEARRLYWLIAAAPDTDVEVPVLRAALALLGRRTRDLEDDAFRLKRLAELRLLGDPAAANAAAAEAAAQMGAANEQHAAALRAVEVAKAKLDEANGAMLSAQTLTEDSASARRAAAALEVELHGRGAPAFANAPAVQLAEVEAREQLRLLESQRVQLEAAAAEDREAERALRHLRSVAAPGSFEITRRPSTGEATREINNDDATDDEARLSAAVSAGALDATVDAAEAS